MYEASPTSLDIEMNNNTWNMGLHTIKEPSLNIIFGCLTHRRVNMMNLPLRAKEESKSP